MSSGALAKATITAGDAPRSRRLAGELLVALEATFRRGVRGLGLGHAEDDVVNLARLKLLDRGLRHLEAGRLLADSDEVASRRVEAEAYKIARNEGLMLMRFVRKPWRQVGEDDDVGDEEPAATWDPAAVIDARRALAAVERLPRRSRRVLLDFAAGVETRDVARRLRIGKDGVRKLRQRGRARLMEIVER